MIYPVENISSLNVILFINSKNILQSYGDHSERLAQRHRFRINCTTGENQFYFVTKEKKNLESLIKKYKNSC